MGNKITYQPRPSVVLTAYPDTYGNVIDTNRFAALEGLSIDLNAQQHVEPIHFQVGDGHNPPGRPNINPRFERLRDYF